MARNSSKLIPPPPMRPETDEVFEDLDRVKDLRGSEAQRSLEVGARRIDSSSLLKPEGAARSEAEEGHSRLKGGEAGKRAAEVNPKRKPRRAARKAKQFPPPSRAAWYQDHFTLCAIGIAGVIAAGLLTWLVTKIFEL